MSKVAVTLDTDDPMFSVWLWRTDSQRLAMLKPILELALDTPEQPCVLGARHACRPQTCSPCLVFDLQHLLQTRSNP